MSRITNLLKSLHAQLDAEERAFAKSTVSIQGYTRSDGTYVQAHTANRATSAHGWGSSGDYHRHQAEWHANAAKNLGRFANFPQYQQMARGHEAAAQAHNKASLAHQQDHPNKHQLSQAAEGATERAEARGMAALKEDQLPNGSHLEQLSDAERSAQRGEAARVAQGHDAAYHRQRADEHRAQSNGNDWHSQAAQDHEDAARGIEDGDHDAYRRSQKAHGTSKRAAGWHPGYF